MRSRSFTLGAVGALLFTAAPAFAQNGNGGATTDTMTAKADTTASAPAAAASLVPRNVIQHIRMQD